MNNMLSTLDLPVCWVNENSNVSHRYSTHNLFFAQEDGHLLIKEMAAEDLTSSAESPTIGLSASADKKTMRSRCHVPTTRVQSVSMRQSDRYILLKKYEGFVTSRSEKSFTVRVFESTSDCPVIEAEFDLEELSETDRGLAVEGAALVWTIGYRYEGNTRKRESLIYLRRLPPLSDKEIAQARKETEQLTHGIQWK